VAASGFSLRKGDRPETGFCRCFRNFAKLLTQLGKSEEAAEAWYRAFAIDPKSGTAEEHENLAKTLIEQGKVDKVLTVTGARLS
jgi:tetratricopeptide (TPR) repeat protein